MPKLRSAAGLNSSTRPSVSVEMMQSRAASVMARLRDSLVARADWPSKRRMEVQLRASTSWRTSATPPGLRRVCPCLLSSPWAKAVASCRLCSGARRKWRIARVPRIRVSTPASRLSLRMWARFSLEAGAISRRSQPTVVWWPMGAQTTIRPPSRAALPAAPAGGASRVSAAGSLRGRPSAMRMLVRTAPWRSMTVARRMRALPSNLSRWEPISASSPRATWGSSAAARLAVRSSAWRSSRCSMKSACSSPTYTA